jgi:hypothetical protein
MGKFVVILLKKESDGITTLNAASEKENNSPDFFYKRSSLFYTYKEIEKSFVEYIIKNEPVTLYLEAGNTYVYSEILRIIDENPIISKMNNNGIDIKFINMPGDIEDGFDKIFKSYIDILEEDSKAS